MYPVLVKKINRIIYPNFLLFRTSIKATQNDPLLSKLMIFICKEIDLPLEQFTEQEREVVEGLFKRCRRYKKEVSLLGKKGRKR